MEWLVTVTSWNGDAGTILIQDDEQNLFPGKLELINPETIRAEIADIANVPIERVRFHDHNQTLYRRMSIYRFAVFN